MKKLIALLAVCGFAFTFVACGGQKAEDSTAQDVDSSAVVTEEPAVLDSAASDTTTTTTDTTTTVQ